MQQVYEGGNPQCQLSKTQHKHKEVNPQLRHIQNPHKKRFLHILKVPSAIFEHYFLLKNLTKAQQPNRNKEIS